MVTGYSTVFLLLVAIGYSLGNDSSQGNKEYSSRFCPEGGQVVALASQYSLSLTCMGSEEFKALPIQKGSWKSLRQILEVFNLEVANPTESPNSSSMNDPEEGNQREEIESILSHHRIPNLQAVYEEVLDNLKKNAGVGLARSVEDETDPLEESENGDSATESPLQPTTALAPTTPAAAAAMGSCGGPDCSKGSSSSTMTPQGKRTRPFQYYQIHYEVVLGILISVCVLFVIMIVLYVFRQQKNTGIFYVPRTPRPSKRSSSSNVRSRVQIEIGSDEPEVMTLPNPEDPSFGLAERSPGLPPPNKSTRLEHLLQNTSTLSDQSSTTGASKSKPSSTVVQIHDNPKEEIQLISSKPHPKKFSTN